MSILDSVPNEALLNIKCSACNKFLSYFPIYVDAQNLPICGRCAPLLIEHEIYTRNKLYESVVQYLRFPCMYKSEGCVENLLPSDIPNHERVCPYRIISCTLECIWQGTANELLDHFQEVHPNGILRNDEFEIDILNSYEVFTLLVHNDELFTFRRKFDAEQNVLQCSLFCYKVLDPITKYKYKVTVQNGARNLSVDFTPKSADNFLEENITEININKIKEQLQDPSIIIGTVKVFTEEETKPVTPKMPNPNINLDMLRELECPVCMDYIIAPIYQCITGHSICGDCKAKVPECPTCKCEIKNTQNFTLEKMASLLTYPCKFTDYGCNFASKPGKIKPHQKFCVHGPHGCPLQDYEDCKWVSSAKDLYAHVFNVHHDNILDLDNITVFIDEDYYTTEDNQCYIKKFSNLLFKLHYRYSQNCFYWSMQLIGPPEEAKNYKYEIDVFDNTQNNKKVFVRSFCAQLKPKNETFAEEGQYVILRLDQIGSFITDELTCAVRIVK